MVASLYVKVRRILHKIKTQFNKPKETPKLLNDENVELVGGTIPIVTMMKQMRRGRRGGVEDFIFSDRVHPARCCLSRENTEVIPIEILEKFK